MKKKEETRSDFEIKEAEKTGKSGEEGRSKGGGGDIASTTLHFTVLVFSRRICLAANGNRFWQRATQVLQR